MPRAKRTPALIATLLGVELLDELAGGVIGAALPQVRTDLDLSYGQIGALFAVPAVVGNLIEVPFGLLSDRGHRRRLIVGGGLAFAAALALMAGAPSYVVLLGAFVAYFPASGAFVSLSQAVLVDTDPPRAEALMARWTLAGSVGVVGGPLLYATVLAMGGSWRVALLLVAIVFAGAVVVVARLPIAEAEPEHHQHTGLRALAGAARDRSVLAAIALLHVSDLLGDVLAAFLALYLVDVRGWHPGTAALGLAVWAGAGLFGDALAVPLLDRLEGRRVVRVSALVAGLLYAGLLVVDGGAATMALIGLLGLVTAGWYPVLQARLYATRPGRSGLVASLGSASGIVAGLVPLALGLSAGQFGLAPTMWLLLIGPLALILGLRTTSSQRASSRASWHPNGDR